MLNCIDRLRCINNLKARIVFGSIQVPRSYALEKLQLLFLEAIELCALPRTRHAKLWINIEQ
jgi:hypothetical protein